ncbi:MAG: hypothetical protein HC900_03440 [Methylacidiphilales bacterium]|nr:hypothetical protein [Candidatus Methylacidiphilales bacterium]
MPGEVGPQAIDSVDEIFPTHGHQASDFSHWSILRNSGNRFCERECDDLKTWSVRSDAVGSDRARVAADPAWRAVGDGITLSVRLTPRGGRDALDGLAELSDGRRVLAARVRAVPEAGAANAALFAVAMLANENPALNDKLQAFPPGADREGPGHEAARGLTRNERGASRL